MKADSSGTGYVVKEDGDGNFYTSVSKIKQSDNMWDSLKETTLGGSTIGKAVLSAMNMVNTKGLDMIGKAEGIDKGIKQEIIVKVESNDDKIRAYIQDQIYSSENNSYSNHNSYYGKGHNGSGSRR